MLNESSKLASPATQAIRAAVEQGKLSGEDPGFALVLTGAIVTDIVRGCHLENVQFELEAHGLELREDQAIAVARVALMNALKAIDERERAMTARRLMHRGIQNAVPDQPSKLVKAINAKARSGEGSG